MKHAVALTALIIFSAAIPGSAAAHSLGQSYVFLRVFDDSIGVRLEITVDDLDRVLRLGWSSRNGVPREQIRNQLGAILAYVQPRVHVVLDGRALPLRFTGHDVRDIEIADYVLLHFVIEGIEAVPERLDIEYSVLFDIDTNHRNLLVIEQNWGTGTVNNESRVSLVFSPDDPRQTLDLTSPSLLRGFLAFVRLGVWHIWIGIDHILFLFALILPSVLRRTEAGWEPATGFRPALYSVVAIVTFFTIAHSVTLSLAALGVVRLPERLVEATIAASIAAAALYNLFPRMVVKEWMIAFVFGLFHGFGFANVLGELALERRHLVLSLFGFNLGVEAGQVAVICAIFPVLFILRTRAMYRPGMRYASVALIAIALFWFVERAFELPLSGYARMAPEFIYRHLLASI